MPRRFAHDAAAQLRTCLKPGNTHLVKPGNTNAQESNTHLQLSNVCSDGCCILVHRSNFPCGCALPGQCTQRVSLTGRLLSLCRPAGCICHGGTSRILFSAKLFRSLVQLQLNAAQGCLCTSEFYRVREQCEATKLNSGCVKVKMMAFESRSHLECTRTSTHVSHSCGGAPTVASCALSCAT